MEEKRFQQLVLMGKEMFRKYPFTAYTNELSIDEEIYALFGKINEVTSLTNDMVAYLNTFIEEFETNLSVNVQSVFDKLVADGFFENLVNNGVFPEFLSELKRLDLKIDTENKKLKDYVDVQDAKKADLTYVETLFKNIGDSSPKDFVRSETELNSKYPNGADFTVGVVNATDNTTIIYAWDGKKWVKGGLYGGQVIPDDSITESKYQDDSVTRRKTSFQEPFETQINLIDRDKILKGRYQYPQNGGWITQDGWNYSDYFEVKERTRYTSNGVPSFWVWFDLNKTIIPTETNSPSVITSPSNARYCRKVIATANLDTICVFEGVGQFNVPYYYKDNAIIGGDGLIELYNGQIIKKNSLSRNTLNFQTRIPWAQQINLFDKSNYNPYGYITYNTLEMYYSNGWKDSNWFPVIEGETYTTLVDGHWKFKDVNDNFLEGQLLTTVVAPKGAVQACVAFNFQYINSYMVVKGSTYPSSYIPHYYEDRSLIVPSNQADVLGWGDNRFIFPSELFLVENEDYIIRTDNIVYTPNENATYEFGGLNTYSSSKTQLLISPSIAVTYPSRISGIINQNTSESLLQEVSVKISSQTKTNKTPTVLLMGDSITNRSVGYRCNQYLKKYGVIPKNIGRLTNGGGVMGEGREGWRWTDFAGTTVNSNGEKIINQTNSPFINDSGVFDFNYYMTNNSYSGVDIVTLALGVNDISNYSAIPNAVSNYTIEQIIANAKTSMKIMIDSIQAYDDTIKIGVVPPFVSGTGNTARRAREAKFIEEQINYLKTFNNVHIMGNYLGCSTKSGKLGNSTAGTKVNNINETRKGSISTDVHDEENNQWVNGFWTASFIMNMID